jgi:hypothetical protein
MAVVLAPQLFLAFSGGFEVRASDGVLGVVETPLFPADVAEPDFLVVRVCDGGDARRPVVSAAFVEAVDAERRIVFVHGETALLARLPEHLPVTACREALR